jgi:hypothetical protein
MKSFVCVTRRQRARGHPPVRIFLAPQKVARNLIVRVRMARNVLMWNGLVPVPIGHTIGTVG